MRSRRTPSSRRSRTSSPRDDRASGTLFAFAATIVMPSDVATPGRAPADDGLHVVFFTSSFPAAVGGVDMVLVRRARELARHASVTAVVPTPWVPRAAARLSPRWARYAQQARVEVVGGIEAFRPRYVQVPRSGALAGVAMAVGALPIVRRLRRAGRCDVLFAQSIVPDGLAAALLGRWTRTPVACIGRGTDVHDVARSEVVRALVGYTLRNSTAVAVVAQRLGASLDAVGAARPIEVLTDGVDLECFAPGDRASARRSLGVDARTRLIVQVGRLVPGKGLETLLDALPRVRADAPVDVALVGAGPLAAPLAAQARRLGIAQRVRFVGEVAHDDVPRWFQAADVVTLPSVAEGFPNSVREALACGRPVVATPVGDIPRVVTPDVGRLVPVDDAAALAAALSDALHVAWDAAAIRSRVAGMTWAANARATHAFLAAAVQRTPARPDAGRGGGHARAS
jgi:teichuronic acid biosynthesis glycosyltransferase TuaC